MSEDAARHSRLGRGLAALIGDAGLETTAVESARKQRTVPLEFLSPNPRNPRRSFDENELEELTQSVREKGIVQPLLVRPVEGEEQRFEIIAGERRWRAAQRAGLPDVPVFVAELNDREALEVAIIENVQRADLNAIEEALGYQQLIDEFGYSQAELGSVIGKSRSHVANTLRLLRLPESVQEDLREGRLSAGHARTLITSDNPEELASQIVKGNLSVRDAERLSQNPDKIKNKSPKDTSNGHAKGPDQRALETALTDVLGLNVRIDHKGKKGGELRIAYKTLDQLDDICRRLRSTAK